MDRHLLPDEIDQLLDGEAGFGTVPLQTHVRRCAACRAEVESARSLVRELERLPHLAPSPLFTAHVMARIQVFVPWHVAALDTVHGLLPRSRPGRLVAGSTALAAATLLSLASLWIIAQLDVVLFALNLGIERVREGVVEVAGTALAAALGEPVLQLIRATGVWGGAAAALVLFAVAAGASGVLRALARSRTR